MLKLTVKFKYFIIKPKFSIIFFPDFNGNKLINSIFIKTINHLKNIKTHKDCPTFSFFFFWLYHTA